MEAIDLPQDSPRKFMKMKPIRTNNKNGGFKKNEEEEEALLSPASRMFHEPNYNIYIVAIMGWKGSEDFDVIKQNLASTIVKVPRFSCLQVVDEKDGGKIKWVPTELNLEDHIIVPEIDPNINSPDEFVDNYISNLSKTPINMSKPLWDLHILNINTSDANIISIFHFHHSLGDGISLISNLLANTRKTSDPNSLPTFPTPKRKFPQNKGGPWQYFMKLWLFLRLVGNTAIDLMMFVATAMFLKDAETPIRKSLPDGISSHRRFVRRTVSMDDIKLMKNATNATVNDVVLGLTQAGLSRYLNRRYGELGGRKEQENIDKKNYIPDGIRFRATVLINLRPFLGLKTMDEMMEKKGLEDHGNCFGFVLLPFKICMVDNPLDHVRIAKTTMDRKKQSLEVICTTYILDIVLKFFGYKAATFLARRVPSHTNLAFSNVMGPIEEISYCGHPMSYLAATCYGQPTGLMIHVVSYINKLTFAISVDERAVPDPYQLGNDIVESLEVMKRAVLEKH